MPRCKRLSTVNYFPRSTNLNRWPNVPNPSSSIPQMVGRLIRAKVAMELAMEFQTLCSGVPGSYAVVPSPPPAPAQPARPDPHAASATTPLSGPAGAAGAGGACNGNSVNSFAGFSQSPSQLDASGLRGVALEPSIGSIARAGSCKLVPLGGLAGVAGGALGASAQLLAAFTDAGCRPTTQGSVGRIDVPRGGLPTPDASARVFPQTHDGSGELGGARLTGGADGVEEETGPLAHAMAVIRTDKECTWLKILLRGSWWAWPRRRREWHTDKNGPLPQTRKR
jgi:hypothetical protein